VLLFPQQQRGLPTQPYSRQADQYMRHHIDHGVKSLTLAEQVDGLVAES